MPLSRLENFLINTDGNILYVNPSDLDATDSFDNKGNSLTRPFATLQRALIEAARFAYQAGPKNDKFDKTTILLYPGEHLIDNRPGYYIDANGVNPRYQEIDVDGITQIVSSPNIELTSTSDFNIGNNGNILYKFNSVHGGVIVPKGTSIIGMDLRKTKIRPLYVPDAADADVAKSAIFRVTGGCYFWQFSIFDADRAVYYNRNFGVKTSPSKSHHKLTVFEYADGVNKEVLTQLTDLEMYYFKLMNAYGNNVGDIRRIQDYPVTSDFEPNNPEYRIVGELKDKDYSIQDIRSSGSEAQITTIEPHGLNRDDPIYIAGVAASSFYNGGYLVSGITSERTFTYKLPSTPNNLIVAPGNSRVIVEADNVDGASPYIFNCSLRSAYGMSGLHADGSKSTGFKSMVVAQYTGIGLQKDNNAFVLYDQSTDQYKVADNVAETDKPLHTNQDAVYRNSYLNHHIKASNDAVIQAVSTFAIGFAEHFVSENGADQSITNSNSNFGSRSLVSTGFRKESFPRDDTGYITHIIPPQDLQDKPFNVLWRVLDPKKTKQIGISSHLYLLQEGDKETPPTNIVNGFRVGSKNNEILSLTVNIDGALTTWSSPVLMDVPTGDGPSSSKRFTVNKDSNGSNDITSDIITLTENHNLYTGESVRIYSDNGVLPNGLEHDQIYYVVNNAVNKIKLAKSYNTAIEGTTITISNKLGGILEVVSYVTDKDPGDPGHPIQWDESNSQWYILSHSGASNQIYSGFNSGDNAEKIDKNNGVTSIQRISESRELDSRTYRIRYVVPKTFVDAKAPESNYVLQESSTVSEDYTISNNGSGNRNPRVISGISSAGTLITVNTEKPHRLSIGDKVHINNVSSSNNVAATSNEGFNGYYQVTSLPNTKTFTYTGVNNAGTFIDNRYSLRSVGSGSTIPSFARNEYDTTYIIQKVEKIQEYISGQQDGVYYLTCLIGNLSPTTNAGFDQLKFKQDSFNLYPTVDKDNPNNDPLQTISAASNEKIGKVNVSSPLNSITKEGIINYIKDIGVGFGVTDAEGGSTGISTVYSERNHNLNSLAELSIEDASTGYAGVSTTIYAVPLINEVATGAADGTINIKVNGSGSITGVTILDGGGAYSVGSTMKVGSGSQRGVVKVEKINNVIGNALQVVGIGTTTNTIDSGYNGLYKITNVPDRRKVEYSTGTNPGIYTTSPTGIFYPTDKVVSVSEIIGVANTTLSGITTIVTGESHGLSMGNRIKINGVTGTAATVFNSDFIIQETVGLTSFTVLPNYGITTATSALTSAEVYKYGLGAFGQDNLLGIEKIAGNLIPLSVGIGTTTSSAINDTATTLTLGIGTVGFTTGSYLQIDDEIMRVRSYDSTAGNLVVVRGLLGTKTVPHVKNSVTRKLDVIPSEVRRFSSIRASGHTFEYVGYGPGNYSTALPQRRKKTISLEDELISIAKEENGGIVFYSGMNDRGDFFSGERIKPRENFFGDSGDDLTAVFDDVYIRNTLVVGGGPNRILPSQFRGPVNFSNKITSTSEDGILAIKLILKGTATTQPFFQVGNDTSPSLVVNEDTQNVGIRTDDPQYELDIDGTIRAQAYESFELEDLPIGVDEEVTFARNRVLKVNDDGTGYELVDVHDLEAYKLRSLGISDDPTVYVGVGTTASLGISSTTKAAFTGINTSKFFVGESIKIFGASEANVLAPDAMSGQQFERVGYSDTIFTYRYWVSEYDLNTGSVGFSSQIGLINPGPAGVGHTSPKDFNSDNLIKLTLRRSSTNVGLLIYRQDAKGNNPAFDIEIAANHPVITGVSTVKLTSVTGIEVNDEIVGFSSLSVYPAIIDPTNPKYPNSAGINTVQSINTAQKVITLRSPVAHDTSGTTVQAPGSTGRYIDVDETADISDAKLIAILGPKELRSSLTDIVWKDYGNYDQTTWSTKGAYNNFDEDEIHFPAIATTGHRKGWGIDEVVKIGIGTIYVRNAYKFNDDKTAFVGFGVTSECSIVHDNTYNIKKAIDNTVASGGNYLDLPSGTYLTEGVTIPSGFTISGNGKNSILKQQYYSNSLDDHAVPNFAGNISASDQITNISADDISKLSVGMVVNYDNNISGSGNLSLTSGVKISNINTSTNVITLDTSFTGSGTNVAKLSAGFPLSTSDGNFIGIAVTNGKDVTLNNFTVDGTSSNNILYDDATVKDANYLINLNSVESSLVKATEVRNSPGGGLYVANSNRVSIENSTFVDGCLSDREPFQPLDASSSKVLRVNDCLFENYPGAVDLSATEVVSTGGNIVRNCGTGIKIYAAGKLTTTNNIILGPSDEYIPSPDIYDSDFNSINLTVDTDADFFTPVYQYIRNGSEYDLSSASIVCGIATIINEGAANETLGDTFLEMDQTTQATSSTGMQFGYVQFKLPLSKSSTLVGSGSSALGYTIIATEYLSVPIGFTTSVGITTGVFNQTGAGATNYTVTLSSAEDHVGFATGDIVRLVNHESTPDLTGIACTVSQKTVGAITATLRLDLPTPTTVSSVNGQESGYITIRNVFSIAKGRVGVI